MKTHPSKTYDYWHGVDLSVDSSRIEDKHLAVLWNAWCDRTGQIQKAYGYYPVALADAFGLTVDSGQSKMWTMARFRGKDSNARALAVFGDGLYRSTPNSLYDDWGHVTFTDFLSAPALNRASAISFRNRYGYHQNGVDMPFRVLMEEDDGSDPSLEAEILGLRAPAFGMEFASQAADPPARFPAPESGGTLIWTNYCITFVYGDRGESGPSPWYAYSPSFANGPQQSVSFQSIPLGPEGCTARRIYRTQIGRGAGNLSGSAESSVKALFDLPVGREFFFLAEIKNNSTTTFTDDKDDSNLDFTRRVPPPRPFVPRAYYQTIHLDRLVWANLTDHPWTMGVMADPTRSGFTNYRVSISNTSNGTITFEKDNAGWTTDFTVDNYKTKSLAAILTEIITEGGGFFNAISSLGYTSAGACAIPADGIDLTRRYVFREISQVEIFDPEDVCWFEAIDSGGTGEGPERHPNRVMWSALDFVEEVNVFNQFDVAKDDAYPVTNLQHDDFTLCVSTQDKWWLVSGSFVPDEFFVPDVTVSASRAEHGSLCTRPDACVSTPYGIFFISIAGVRILRGGSDAPAGLEIDKAVLERLLTQPPTRDNPCMVFWNATIYIAYPGMVTV